MLAASLVLLERCVPLVVRRRSVGPGNRNLADRDDVLKSETASSSLFALSSEVAVSGTDVEIGPSTLVLSGEEDRGCGRAGRAGGGGEVEDEDEGGSSSGTSTSSASRYHFRLLVQRPQPSFPLRPFCHCEK
jgi:hypothetical protein